MTNIANTATASRRCHRHWVLGPLFLSVVVFSSFLSLSVSVPPQVASKTEEEVLVQDARMITVHRNGLSLYGMHGAFTVSEKAGRVSVAALTTPVLVRGADVLAIVPVGFQWRSDERRMLLPLPSAFQYAKLQELSDAPFSPPLARLDPSLILPGTLRLPAARQRHEDTVRMRHLSTIARQIVRGRSIARVVQDDATSAALVSREGYRIVPSLLAELKDSPLDRAALFPFLTEKEEGAFLALFHPSFRDQAALFVLDGLSPEARVVYRRTLPSADLLPDALSPFAVSRWEDDVVRTFAELPDPLPLFADLLGAIERVVQAQHRYGYVERAQRYIAAMQHLSTLLELTPELQERLDALPRLFFVSDQTIPPVAGSSSSASLSSSIDSAALEDLHRRVVADLTAQGGMLIPNTTIEPLSPTAVRVASLVLATSKGDELLDFTYDTERQEVSDVIRGSTRYPYAVPLSQLVEWMKRE